MAGLPDTLELRCSPRSAWVPIRYVDGGGYWLVSASSDDARWPIEALRAGEVTVRIGAGPELVRQVTLVVESAERRRFLEIARAHFGPEAAARWFADSRRVLRLDAPGPSLARAEYDAWVSAEFDLAAESYETRVRANPFERRARERSLNLLTSSFAPGARLLEMGSGPGLETLPLLEAGFHVTAVDLSSPDARPAAPVRRGRRRFRTSRHCPTPPARPGPAGRERVRRRVFDVRRSQL